MPLRIRMATGDDAAAMAEIYAPVVRDTAISFELVPPTEDEFRSRIRGFLDLAPCLVAEDGGRVVGYAYGSAFRARPAYRFSVETTVYVREGERRRGVARALYGDLLPRLQRQRFRTAIAGVTLPNPASVGLHESLGFRPVGVFHRVGFKFGAWHDVGFWERPFGEFPADPPEPLPVREGQPERPPSD